jgi:hypothetical protein
LLRLLLLRLFAPFLVNIQLNALKIISIFEKVGVWETQSDLVPATNFRFNKRIPTLRVKNCPWRLITLLPTRIGERRQDSTHTKMTTDKLMFGY